MTCSCHPDPNEKDKRIALLEQECAAWRKIAEESRAIIECRNARIKELEKKR